MVKIDSHQHFWKFDPVRDSWITDDMSVIRRDFLPGDLFPLLRDNGIDGCVAVQADQSEEENNFLLQLAAENSFIKGIIGWVDFRAADIEERLSLYHQNKMVKGFRHVLQGEADRAFMLQPSFKWGVQKLRQFGFTYDILIYPDQLVFIKEFVAAFPDQLFVIDHIAKPAIKGKEIMEWTKNIKAVAAYGNVYCKISGMVTEADWYSWKTENFTPYLDVVFEAFGSQRILFGSDWPVCLVAGGYDKALGIVDNYISKLSSEEQKLFWGTNAIKFYNIAI